MKSRSLLQANLYSLSRHLDSQGQTHVEKKPSSRESKLLPNLRRNNPGAKGDGISSFLTHRSRSIQSDDNMSTLQLGARRLIFFSLVTHPWHGTTLISQPIRCEVCKLSEDSPGRHWNNRISPSPSVAWGLLSSPRLLINPAI